jgi:cell division protein FtsQ
MAKEQVKKRRQLQQQRRLKTIKSSWQFLCMVGILGGVLWIVSQPNWQISKPEQIRVKGNRYLSETAIRSSLGIAYPQPLMDLEPEKLRTQLLSRRTVVNVTIDRALLPPRLTVQIEDLRPVAQVQRNLTDLPLAFIDERGVEIPIVNYLPTIQRSAPKLRLIQPERGICPNWQNLYPAIDASPVLVGIIDCRNPQNLFLQTEVGKVRLGNIGTKERLTAQIQQLDRLRNWQKSKDSSQIDYLDLESPNSAPKLKLKSSGAIDPPPKPRTN